MDMSEALKREDIIGKIIELASEKNLDYFDI